MRNKKFENIANIPTPAHLELGLNTTALIMNNHLNSATPEAYKLLTKYISKDGNEEIIDELIKAIGIVKARSFLVCVGYEIDYMEKIMYKFEGTITIPNGNNVDFCRIEDNYSSLKHFTVLDPISAVDMICPDSVVILPVYPLSDGTIMTYNYPSKIINSDLRRSCFQIIGLEQSRPLPIQYGYDDTGLTKVLNRIETSVFTHYITYKNDL